MHATRFLKPRDKTSVPAAVAVFGNQRYLKVACLRALTRRVLGEEEEAGPSRFEGETAPLATVLSELATVSMFGGRRLVLVENADEFVSRNRAALERYVAKPARGGVLVLDVKTWPKTTKLAKAVAKEGLDLDCGELAGNDLRGWLAETATETHGMTLGREAAALLADLAGPDLGLLERELAKLADYAADAGEITAEDVTKLVGGEKTEGTFRMLALLRDGDTGAALTELDRLLRSGEAAMRMLGGVTYVYRKLAAAADLTRRGMPARTAVRQAGVFPKEQEAAAAYLNRLGPRLSGRFFAEILEADAALRGAGRLPDRIVMERLLVKLAGPDPAAAGRP